MKIKNNVKWGMFYRVLGELVSIPAGMQVTVTKLQHTALMDVDAYTNAIGFGWLEEKGGRKAKKAKKEDVDGLDSN